MTIEGIFQEALRSHSFSQNTKQLQRIFVPGVRGGGNKFPHSGGLVASEENEKQIPSDQESELAKTLVACARNDRWETFSAVC